MPKLVDHNARRRELADATWRVVRRGGVERATVREVAAEAGCSPGSLRYYFPAQAELIGFAMDVVAERVRARIATVEPGGDVRLAVERLLEQVLPLDDERRTEGEVWLAFAARAQSDSALREQRDATHKALGLFVRRCVDALAEAGVVRPELSRELEASRLHALVDGLAVHGITSPETMTPRRMRKVLRAHLATLA
jgi:AcrR family transcriptional regulator